jgi:hypothetical protein
MEENVSAGEKAFLAELAAESQTLGLTEPKIPEESEAKVEDVAEIAAAEPEIVDEKPVLSEVEKTAMEQGWKPKDQFNGDDWVPADEFVRRGPLLKRISEQSKDIKELKASLEHFKEIFHKKETSTYSTRMDELLAERIKAVELSDVEAFKKIDMEIMKLNQQRGELETVRQVQKPQEAPKQDPAFVEFAAKHESNWFNNNSPENIAMRAFANAIAQDLDRKHPTLAPSEGLKIVEQRVREQFPHRFNETNRNQPSKVGVSTALPETKSSTKDLIDKLTPMQKEMGMYAVKASKNYTLLQYAKDLEKQGVLGK